MGKTSGISLYLSNNIHTESTKEHILWMTRRAVAHASQINEESLFAGGICLQTPSRA